MMKANPQETSFVFEREEVRSAVETLRTLASELPEEAAAGSPRNRVLLAAALLEAWLENGGFNKVEPSRRRPFQISESDRKKIPVSPGEVGVMTLANNICRVLPYDMQKVQYSHISNWLTYIGALAWVELPQGGRKRLATGIGEELGIHVAEHRRVDGTTYLQNVFNPAAQQFVIDNLETLMTYRLEENVRKATDKVEKAKAELAALTGQTGEGERPDA